MYIPAHFEERRPPALQALLRDHPLGLLITTSAQPAATADGAAPAPQLEANPIPFLLDAERGPHGTLVAHVARANPLWRGARADVDSLVVFQGPQAYVSPSWYATKAETGKVVPTWNYMVAEARGRLRFIDDAGWLHALVSRLTDRHEAGRAAPWAVRDAPADYVGGLLRAIVGLEIELGAPLVGKWKLSQNRPAADRDGVARGLAAQAAAERAEGPARAVAEQVAAACSSRPGGA